jgi:hypothetical protein
MTIKSMAVTFAGASHQERTVSSNSISEYRWFMDHKQITGIFEDHKFTPLTPYSINNLKVKIQLSYFTSTAGVDTFDPTFAACSY